MSLISVIIPVFQAESYLHRCIDSILSQTHTNLELILVDDGSTDRSGSICDQYATKDNRVRVIHKENAGVSAARNSGLKISNGSYITFIDSDDYVAPEYLEQLVRTDADLAVCGCFVVSESGEKSVLISTADNHCNATPSTIAEWFDNDYLKYVWGKLFRRNIIEDHCLQFDTRISLGEDTLFVMQYALVCNNLASISSNLYFYIKYPSGTLTKQLTHHMVLSNSLRDSLLDKILSDNNIPSKTFYTAQYVSKQKMKYAFLSIFENTQISIHEKHKWYRLFFKLPLFVDHIDIITEDFSKKLRFIIKLKSASLLIAVQLLATAKPSKRNTQP